MTAPLHVVILAAGEGKRMKSRTPKVLQKIAGRPMLAHVIDAARALSPAGIHVVYGHGGDAVRVAKEEAERILQGRGEAMEIVEAQKRLAEVSAQLAALERLRKNLRH